MPTITSRRRRAPGSMVVLGFPVSVKPGFWVLLVLAVVASPGSLGLWLAGALAVFTLAHELGHAAAARAFGADATISLDLMAGYTSYVPTRPMTVLERTAVILAGPMAEIVPGLILLIAMGADPLSYESVTATDARWAVWVAGPVLGLVNLVPLLPLDGGMIVSVWLEKFWPRQGRRIALAGSIVLTAILAVVLLLSTQAKVLGLFAGGLLVVQVLHLRAEVRPPRPSILRTPGLAIAEQLLESGDTRRASQFGAELFEKERSPEVALLMARCAARAGEISTAMAWLQAAGFASDDPLAVADELESNADFAVVRASPGASTLRRTLTGS